MSKLALIGGPQALAAAVVVGVLAVVGAVVAITRPDGASEKAPEAAALVAPLSGTSASEGAAVGSTAAVTEAATKPLEGESAVTVAATPDPAFDVVRVDAEGNATIAGRAVPGAQVALLLDGAEVAEAKADGSGAFALLVTLPPSETPRALSLRAMGADGVARVSVEDAIVAPFAGPTVAAVSGAAGDATGDATGAAAAAAGSDAGAAGQATAEAAASGQVSAEAAAPAILMADPAGVKVQGGVVESLVLDVIGYSDSGAVQLSGRAPVRAGAEAFARIYLDNGAVADVKIGPDGAWQAELAEIAAGIYTLRVDEVDAVGKVLSRVETPFRREAPEALAALMASKAAAETATATVADTVTTAEATAAAATGTATATASQTATNSAAAEATPLVSQEATENAAQAAAQAASQAASQGAQQASAEGAGSAARVKAVTVQPGNTLWAIARERYGSGTLYVRLFEANKDAIRNPDLIYPGQVFEIPE